MPRPRACPCGLGQGYAACCAPLHHGSATAATAEELMRSRYSAFVAGEASYLLATWHPATRPDDLELDAGIRWTELEVLDQTGGGPDDRRGVVEFRATYQLGDEVHTLHEVSRFRRDGGRWLYVRGRATWS